jgi:lipopolysaccharide biosynthesis regulator YciM
MLQQTRVFDSMQMIKRQGKRTCGEANIPESIKILHRGLTQNPASARIAQAWGLAELQRGNDLGAVKLLERCVELDPALAPVKDWQIVRDAKARAEKVVAERREKNE